MSRWRSIGGIGIALAAVFLALLLASVANAVGPGDPTSVTVSCAPATVTTGSAVSCAVTVTDTTPGDPTSPTGTVDLNAGAGATGDCTLTAAGDGMTAGCTSSVTVPVAGQQEISADYGGDDSHEGAAGTATVSGIDPTSTTIVCTPATVTIGQVSKCLATVSDPSGTGAITGTVSFGSNPSSGGTLSDAGSCSLSTASGGASGSCPISFTPSAPGSYAISAAYTGDDTHAASSAPAATVTANYSSSTSFEPPAGTLAPGSGESGAAGTATNAELTLPGGASVSKAGVAGISLSCQSSTGTTCAGTLTLTAFEAPKTTSTKPKSKTKTKTKKKKTKTKAKSKSKSKTKTKTKPKVTTQAKTKPAVASDLKHKKPVKSKPKTKKKKTKTKAKPKPKPKAPIVVKTPPLDTVVKVGSVSYSVAAGGTETVSLHLTAAALKLLTADKGKLAVSALAKGGSQFTGGTIELTLTKAKPAPKPKPKPKKKKTKKKKPTKKKKTKTRGTTKGTQAA